MNFFSHPELTVECERCVLQSKPLMLNVPASPKPRSCSDVWSSFTYTLSSLLQEYKDTEHECATDTWQQQKLCSLIGQKKSDFTFSPCWKWMKDGVEAKHRSIGRSYTGVCERMQQHLWSQHLHFDTDAPMLASLFVDRFTAYYIETEPSSLTKEHLLSMFSQVLLSDKTLMNDTEAPDKKIPEPCFKCGALDWLTAPGTGPEAVSDNSEPLPGQVCLNPNPEPIQRVTLFRLKTWRCPAIDGVSRNQIIFIIHHRNTAKSRSC